MAYAQTFWNLIAERYSKQPVSDEARYQKKLSMTQAHLTKDMHAMEFGCGTGTTAIYHAPFVADYLGIDTSDKMIEIANRKKRLANLTKVNFEQGSIENIEAAEARYDVILGLSILHLLSDPESVIRQVHTLLKPDGLFVSSTVCTIDTMPFFRYIAPLLGMIGLPKVKNLSESGLEAIINQAGFKTIEKLSVSSDADSCFILSKKVS